MFVELSRVDCKVLKKRRRNLKPATVIPDGDNKVKTRKQALIFVYIYIKSLREAVRVEEYEYLSTDNLLFLCRLLRSEDQR